MVELFTALPRPLTALRRAGAIGDSITADAGGNYWTNWGWLSWTRRYLTDRIDLPASRNWAEASKTIAEVKAEQLPPALAADLDLCFVHCGTNSIDGTAANTADYIAELVSIYDQLVTAGTFVVAIPIRAHNSPASLSGDDLLQFAAINRAIVEYARDRPGILVIDVNPLYLDFSTGDAKAAYLRDGIHDNQLSAKAMGKLVADALSPLLPARDDRIVHPGDLFDASRNPHGNLLANGLLAGTGGTTINGASGSVATGWRLYRGSNSGTLTAVGSKVAHPAYPTMAGERITLGGTGDDNGVYFDQEQAIGTKVSIGDVLQGEIDLTYDLTAGFVGFGLQIVARDSSFSPLAITYDGFYSATNGLLPADTGSLTLRTDELTLPASTAYVTFTCFVHGPASGSVAATVELFRASLRKVS